jgi:hypothetical protein
MIRAFQIFLHLMCVCVCVCVCENYDMGGDFSSNYAASSDHSAAQLTNNSPTRFFHHAELTYTK